jgi:hypothetical protein
MSNTFKPDFSRKLYTISIDVYPNGNVFGLSNMEEGYKATFQEIIGALEIVKSAYLREHGAKVQHDYDKADKP